LSIDVHTRIGANEGWLTILMDGGLA